MSTYPQLAANGLATRAELVSAGIAGTTVASWVRRGALVRVHRGVYRAPGDDGPATLPARAALLAAAHAEAVASHATAAGVLGVGLLAVRGPAHVTVSRRLHRRERPGLCFHRADLDPADVLVVAGLPVTAVSRTLLDLLRADDPLPAVWGCEAAVRARLLTLAEVRGLAGRVAGRPFAARVKCRVALVDSRSESPLETAIRLLLAAAGLPPLAVQFVVRTDDGHVIARLDLAVPQRRLGIEADGRDPHDGLRAAYVDRWRTNALVGWTVLRFTWYDVLQRPGYVVATVRAHLGYAG